MPRVLLVDDDRDLLVIYETALRSAGFEVSLAHDSDEAFEIIDRGTTFDVAVLDVVMRTPNEGFVLARRMRSDSRTSRVPLVMISSVNTVNAGKGFDFRFSDRDRDPKWLPIDRFVDKPVKASRLVELVRGLLS